MQAGDTLPHPPAPHPHHRPQLPLAVVWPQASPGQRGTKIHRPRGSQTGEARADRASCLSVPACTGSGCHVKTISGDEQ